MTKATQQAIVANLSRVAAERELRARDPALQRTVDAVKTYQQQRFMRSYADLASSPRYARAIQFFLDDLYGPMDFTRRDAEFLRVVPAIVRLFPRELSHTIEDMATLHALSEVLDTQMARHIGHAGTIRVEDYSHAWRRTGQASQRATQIELVLGLGRELDRLTHTPLLRRALKAMRLPARRSGFAELQAFLEEGFDAFHAMRGATEFLDIVAKRERDFVDTMFGGSDRVRGARDRELPSG